MMMQGCIFLKIRTVHIHWILCMCLVGILVCCPPIIPLVHSQCWEGTAGKTAGFANSSRVYHHTCTCLDF